MASACTHIEDKKKKLKIQETNNPQKQNVKTIYSKETTHRSSGSYLFALAVLMFSQGRKTKGDAGLR